MTEAWLLIDEAALRRAADDPTGRTPLEWPALGRLERIHAKEKMVELFRSAANQTGRRRRRAPAAEERRARLAALIDDFSVLRRFTSFRDLERDIRAFCAMLGPEDED